MNGISNRHGNQTARRVCQDYWCEAQGLGYQQYCRQDIHQPFCVQYSGPPGLLLRW